MMAVGGRPTKEEIRSMDLHGTRCAVGVRMRDEWCTVFIRYARQQTTAGAARWCQRGR